MTPDELIDALEEAFDCTLPDRYRAFLSDGEYEDLPALKLLDGYVQGTVAAEFVHEGLADFEELAMVQLLDEIDDIEDEWDDLFEGFVPFAVLESTEDDEDEDDPRLSCFLVIRLEDTAIMLFEHEGWKLYPLAATLDDFLAGNAAGADFASDHDQVAFGYAAFGWWSDGD